MEKSKTIATNKQPLHTPVDLVKYSSPRNCLDKLRQARNCKQNPPLNDPTSNSKHLATFNMI